MSSKPRNYRLISYLSEDQILDIIDYHSNQIKAYAYILHDKDIRDNRELKPSHYHILLCLYNGTTLNSLLNWFIGFEDDNGQEINTFGKVMSTPSGAFGYLTHNTVSSKHKYQYDESLIKCVNREFFNLSDEAAEDKSLSALNELLDGVPLREVAQKYGKHFILHYGHIKMLFNDIQLQCGGKLL